MSEGVDSVKEGLCLIWSPKNAITQMTGREGLCLIWSPTNAIYSDRFRTDCLKSKLDCLSSKLASCLSASFSMASNAKASRLCIIQRMKRKIGSNKMFYPYDDSYMHPWDARGPNPVPLSRRQIIEEMPDGIFAHDTALDSEPDPIVDIENKVDHDAKKSRNTKTLTPRSKSVRGGEKSCKTSSKTSSKTSKNASREKKSADKPSRARTPVSVKRRVLNSASVLLKKPSRQ